MLPLRLVEAIKETQVKILGAWSEWQMRGCHCFADEAAEVASFLSLFSSALPLSFPFSSPLLSSLSWCLLQGKQAAVLDYQIWDSEVLIDYFLAQLSREDQAIFSTSEKEQGGKKKLAGAEPEQRQATRQDKIPLEGHGNKSRGGLEPKELKTSLFV